MPNPSGASPQVAAKLLAQDLDVLYAHLAESSPEGAGRLFSPDEQIDFGRKLFAKLEAKLHDAICVQWKYCEKRKTRNFQDASEIVVAVAESIATTFTGFPVVVLSAIVVKRGLDHFCGCEEAN